MFIILIIDKIHGNEKTEFYLKKEEDFIIIIIIIIIIMENKINFENILFLYEIKLKTKIDLPLDLTEILISKYLLLGYF
jgi:hypothetical protein